MHVINSMDPRIKKSHCFSKEKQDFSSPRMTQVDDLSVNPDDY